VTESNLSYGWKTWTVDYKLKKKLLITKADFWRRDARTSGLLKVRNEVSKKSVGNKVLKGLENSTLKWYGHVVCMEDNRWTKGSPGGKRQGRPEVKWEKEVERVMKQRNLISDDAVNRQLWPLKNSNRWTTGKKERKKKTSIYADCPW